MNVKVALGNEKILRAVIGIGVKEFEELLPIFEQCLYEYYKNKRPNRKRRVGGGRKGALRTVEEKLFMILFYIKQYPTYDLLAFLYGVTRSKPYYWVVKLLPILEKALGRKIVLPKRTVGELNKLLENTPEIKEIFVDATERDINRPKDNKTQNKYYSGKKKRHTVKNTVITDGKGNILYVGKSNKGKIHDKKLYDKEDIGKLQIEKYGDLGYIGGENIIVPIKKTRGKKLTRKEKEDNKILRTFRVIVEHGIGKIKIFGIVNRKFRNRIYGEYNTVKMNMKDKVILIAGGLTNLRLQMRLQKINNMNI